VIPDQATALPQPTLQSAGKPAYDGALEWPLVAMHAKRLWDYTQGTGITVAVVDTGIDSQLPDLAHALVGRQDLTPGPVGDQSADSEGTAIAGLIAGRGSPADPEIVAGLAPQAGLIDIRVTSHEDGVSADLLAQGINAAVHLHARIIDVPLGVAKDAPALDRAVLAAEEDNCLVIASAGDDGARQWPADTNGVIAVAATASRTMTPGDTLNSYGPNALYAPGTGLYSTVKSGYQGGLSGNEYATAYVSAAAALLWAVQPGLGAAGIRQRLIGDVSDSSTSSAGLGTLDPPAALQVLLPTSQARPSTPSSAAAAPSSGTASRPVLLAVGVALVAIVLFIVLWTGTRGGPRLPPPLDWDLEPR
jgi:subtilisin family serine protease